MYPHNRVALECRRNDRRRTLDTRILRAKIIAQALEYVCQQ